MQYLKDTLEITYVDLVCNTLIWVLTNILVVTSHKIKVKKSNPIAIPSFGLPYSYWGYAIPSWVY
jgi:hypothetical protein